MGISIARHVLGFILIPILVSLLLTIYESGIANIFPFYIFTFFETILLTVFILLPMYLILLRRNAISLIVMTSSAFIAVFVVSLISSYITRSHFNDLSVGAKVLVFNGKITATGYFDLIQHAFEIGLTAAVGALVFYFIACWQIKTLIK